MSAEQPSPKPRRRGSYGRPNRRVIMERAAARRAEREAEKAKRAAARAAAAEERRKRAAQEAEAARLKALVKSGYIEPIYNFPCRGPIDRRTLEGECFKHDWPSELGGLGAYGHLRNFLARTWPDVEINPWTEHQLRSLCDAEHEIKIGHTRLRFVSWTGAGAAGKTFTSGLFACAWFVVDPFNSSVTLTSTTRQIIGQRVWPVIQHFYNTARDPDTGQRIRWGHMVNSRKMVEAKKGDEKHSICALAVESGELQKSVDRIKGRHTPRMMLIIDEANTTPPAIFECISNMAKGCDELIVLVIGNAVSRLDNHGRCCEPRDGWNSITIDDTQWPTKGVPSWSIGPGVCCHYDGEKSPNVRAGQTKWPYIYTYENFIAAQRLGRDSATYWSQERGFWPPEGVTNTVFSEAMIERFDGRGRFTFVSQATPVAFMDPAFGGDRCIAQFGLLGDLPDGRLALQLTDAVEIQINVREKHEVDYQVARQFIEQCKARGVRPQYAGLDATGTGRGVASIVMQEWSDQVHYVEWGGKASEMPASDEDPRPSHEVYFNRVTELWFSARELMRAGQLRGLCNEACIDLTTREFLYKDRRLQVESKEDLRARLHRSPDYGDAVAGLVEVARRHGATPLLALRGAHWQTDDDAADADPYDDPGFQPLDEQAVGYAEHYW